jgi:hypothetical protein
MKPMKFQSVDKSKEIIVISKDVYRIGHVKEMFWGDNNVDGEVYEYCYEVIVNGEYSRLDKYELTEALQDMKFVEGD